MKLTFWNVAIGLGIAYLLFKENKPVQDSSVKNPLDGGLTLGPVSVGALDESSYARIKKSFTKIFGKPYKDQKGYSWDFEGENGVVVLTIEKDKDYFRLILLYQPENERNFMEKHNRSMPYWKMRFHSEPFETGASTEDYFMSSFFDVFFRYLYEGSSYNEYSKLAELSKSGDWELALEVAKGQGLI